MVETGTNLHEGCFLSEKSSTNTDVQTVIKELYKKEVFFRRSLVFLRKDQSGVFHAMGCSKTLKYLTGSRERSLFKVLLKKKVCKTCVNEHVHTYLHGVYFAGKFLLESEKDLLELELIKSSILEESSLKKEVLQKRIKELETNIKASPGDNEQASLKSSSTDNSLASPVRFLSTIESLQLKKKHLELNENQFFSTRPLYEKTYNEIKKALEEKEEIFKTSLFEKSVLEYCQKDLKSTHLLKPYKSAPLTNLQHEDVFMDHEVNEKALKGQNLVYLFYRAHEEKDLFKVLLEVYEKKNSKNSSFLLCPNIVASWLYKNSLEVDNLDYEEEGRKFVTPLKSSDTKDILETALTLYEPYGYDPISKDFKSGAFSSLEIALQAARDLLAYA